MPLQVKVESGGENHTPYFGLVTVSLPNTGTGSWADLQAASGVALLTPFPYLSHQFVSEHKILC